MFPMPVWAQLGEWQTLARPVSPEFWGRSGPRMAARAGWPQATPVGELFALEEREAAAFRTAVISRPVPSREEVTAFVAALAFREPSDVRDTSRTPAQMP